MYVPSLVTWWRLRSPVLLSALSTLSFSPPVLPQPDFLLYHRGIKPRVLSTLLSYPFFFHHPSRFLPLLSLYSSSSSSSSMWEQRDTQKTRAREASLPFSSSISTRLIARSHTTGIELLAVGDPHARLRLFFLRNPLSLSRRAGPHGELCFVLFIGY